MQIEEYPPFLGAEELERITLLVKEAECAGLATIADITSHCDDENNDPLACFKEEHLHFILLLQKSLKSATSEFESCKTLHKSYHDNLRVAHALADSTAVDDAAIHNLRAQIKKTGDALAAVTVKEETVNDDFRKAKSEVAELSALIAKGVALTADQQRTITELVHSKEDAMEDLKNEECRVTSLRDRLTSRLSALENLDKERLELEYTVHSLKTVCGTKKLDADACLRKKDALDADLKDGRATLTNRATNARGIQENISRAKEDIYLLQNYIKAQKVSLSVSNVQQQHLSSLTNEARIKRNDAAAVFKSLQAELFTGQSLLKSLILHLSRLTDQTLHVDKAISAFMKKKRLVEAKKEQEEHIQSSLAKDDELYLEQKQLLLIHVESAKKTIGDLSRELAILKQKHMKLSADEQLESKLSSILEQTRKNIEQEKSQCYREVSSFNKYLNYLNNDMVQCDANATKVHGTALETMNMVKSKENEIYDVKKQALDLENKLKYQQNLHEAAVNDRNVQSRNLLNVQEEIGELRRQLKTVAFRIGALKEEILVKDESTLRAATYHEKIEHETATLENEIKSLQEQNDKAQTYLRQQHITESRLGQHVKEAESEKAKQIHALTLSTSERDRLSAQLISQETEMRRVYHDIKSCMFSLLRGEKKYLATHKSLVELDATVRKNIQLLRLAELNISDAETIKCGVHQMRAELLDLMGQIRALTDSLKHPINIHRWRKLEGSDSSILEIIQLTQSLQRDLISRHNTEMNIDSRIQDIESSYLELKAIHKRQVGPEVLEQIEEMKNVLATKQRALKQMRIQSDLLKATTKEFKYNINSLDRSIHEIKLTYFAQKGTVKENMNFHRSPRKKKVESISIEATTSRSSPS